MNFFCLVWLQQLNVVCLSTFFLFVFTLALVMKGWFRAVAAGFGDPAPAQTVAGLMLLMLVLYTGYTIPKPSMIGALRWISYINVSVCGPKGPLLLIFVSPTADSVRLRGTYRQ